MTFIKTTSNKFKTLTNHYSQGKKNDEVVISINKQCSACMNFILAKRRASIQVMMLQILYF